MERSETFTVGEAARLKLTNIRGRVDIQPGDQGIIAITAVKHDDGRAGRTEIELSQAADGTVSAVTRHEHNLLGWLALKGKGRPCRVDYVVRVPRQCSVDLSIVEGQAQLIGLTGDFETHTVSGDLRLADLSGSLRIHTVSGNVLGERLAATAPVHLSAVSGHITLVGSSLPAVSASTVSGDVSLDTDLAAGPYQFNSVSGDVRLSLPAGTRCAPSLHSLSGRIHRLPAAPGEGTGPSVHLHSVSGDLWLLEPGAATEAPSATQPDRRDLLEQVSRGELSVEEAVNALKER
jgi:hypothetical protein